MGRPFEPIGSPRGQEDPPSSSSGGSSEEEEEEEEGWIDDQEDWQDPTDGLLSRVFEAAEAGDASELAELLADLDVGAIDTRGADSDTAVHLAALYGHADCVRLLLERGARADVPDADGALPLHDAAAGGYSAICGMLLDAAPGCIDRGDGEGDTPLHNAARGSHDEVVELLLSRGANPSLQNDEFKTAAQLAERGTRGRELLDEAARAVVAAAAPQVAPPAAEVA